MNNVELFDFILKINRSIVELNDVLYELARKVGAEVGVKVALVDDNDEENIE